MFEGIVDWVSGVVTDLMDAVSGLFLNTLGTDMTAMEEYFPFVASAFTVMQYMAWALLFLITVWQLFKAFSGPLGESENPWTLIFKSALFAILIYFAKPIFLYILNIAKAPYTALMDVVVSKEHFTFAGIEGALRNGLTNFISMVSVVGEILILILIIALGWNYFKLLLEVVERYIVVGVLCYTSPLAYSMGASQSTSQVFKSWCRMVGSQLLLLIMNVWFLRAFNSSVGHYVGAGGALTNGHGSVFLWLFCALAFLKTAQRFDAYITLFDTPYVRFLQSTTASQVHKGYFSIDKKGRKVDSALIRGTDISDDVSAYDLILKDKERLLSFDEPTRFIFSHSALREGWDNPNVFQICTLKHSNNNIQRRQEVGRGLRLCVNSIGERMDATIPNFDVHSINILTVVASDSYEDFVKGLQTEIKENLYERPSRASKEFFAGKKIVVEGEERVITSQQATAIYKYLLKNDYIDDDDKPTDEYKNAVKDGTLAPLPFEIEPMADTIHKLVQSTYDADALKNMIENGNQSKVQDNKLNDNFARKEFQKLWAEINHKYAYTVEFDSEELIKKAVEAIDKELFVSPLTYTVSTGEQKSEIDADEIKNGVSFKTAKTRTEQLRTSASETIKYDLLGKILMSLR